MKTRQQIIEALNSAIATAHQAAYELAEDSEGKDVADVVMNRAFLSAMSAMHAVAHNVESDVERIGLCVRVSKKKGESEPVTRELMHIEALKVYMTLDELRAVRSASQINTKEVRS